MCIAWGQALFTTALAGAVLAFLLEARGVSLVADNLLLLQPTAIATLVLWLVILAGCLRPRAVRTADAEAVEAEVAAESPRDLARVLLLVLAFGACIAGLEPLGYDVSFWLFVLAALALGGERNPVALALFPPIFTALLIWGFRALVPYPFPTSLL